MFMRVSGLNHNPGAEHRRPGKIVLGLFENTKPKKKKKRSFFCVRESLTSKRGRKRDAPGAPFLVKWQRLIEK